MPHDHDAARLHRADLDREIDTIRMERLLAADPAGPGRDGLLGHARGRAGRILIAAGEALAGRDRAALDTRRA
jgi:hypothetical protein